MTSDYHILEEKNKHSESRWLIKDSEIIFPSTEYYHFYRKKHINSVVSQIKEKQKEIESDIAHQMYVRKDHYPHEGRYYNRGDERWRKKKDI